MFVSLIVVITLYSIVPIPSMKTKVNICFPFSRKFQSPLTTLIFVDRVDLF